MAKEQYNEIFGKNLRAYRESLGQTRLVFVRQYDGFVNTLASYETGEKGPSLKRLIHICNGLKLSPNALLDGLFPWETEIETLTSLDKIMSELAGAERQKVVAIRNSFLSCVLETPPKLSGENLGTRIHLLREDAGLDVSVLAERCMIAKSTLLGYESGQYDPSVQVILRLSEVFGVSPEFLLAPLLDKLSYSDKRYANLRPREMKALLEITRILVSRF